MNAPIHIKEEELTTNYVYSVCASKEQIGHELHSCSAKGCHKGADERQMDTPNFFTAMMLFGFL